MSSLGVLMAGAHAAENMNLQSLTRRLPKLCARLKKFAFVAVAEQVSGLPTRPANQAATLRIEALLHLAAIHCQGAQIPTAAQIREWLNDVLLKDTLGRGEDPPDDVFVSSSASFAGNIRIFTGAWEDPASYLQDLLGAMLRQRGRAWADTALREVTALLVISEAVADRAGVARFTKPIVTMGKSVTVSPSTLAAGKAAAVLSMREVFDLVDPRDLAPFRFQIADGPAMQGQTLGHTDMERRPLLAVPGRPIVMLPTAISAAARRHIKARFAESAISYSSLPSVAITIYRLRYIMRRERQFDSVATLHATSSMPRCAAIQTAQQLGFGRAIHCRHSHQRIETKREWRFCKRPFAYRCARCLTAM